MGCVVPNGDLLFTNYAVTAIGVRRLLYKGPYFCALHLDVMELGGGGGLFVLFPLRRAVRETFCGWGHLPRRIFPPRYGGVGIFVRRRCGRVGGVGGGGGRWARGCAAPLYRRPPPLYRRPPGQRNAGRRESDGIVSWRTVVLRQPGPGTGMTSPFAVQWHEADLFYSTLFFIYIYFFPPVPRDQFLSVRRFSAPPPK